MQNTITPDSIGFGVTVKADAEFVAGEHTATLVDFKNVGPSKFNPEKTQIELSFQLEDGSTTKVWANQAFGFSKLAGWAKLATIIHALTGILPGDKRQLALTKADLIGKSMTVITSTNDKGYPVIEEYRPLDNAPEYFDPTA